MADAILTSARDNDADAIFALVSQGCPPTYANRVGQTALHIGGMWGSVDAVKALLEVKADPNATNMLRVETSLHSTAAGKGSPFQRAECVKLLVSFKGDPNKADGAGKLPIDVANHEQLRLALGAPPLILHKAVKSRKTKALSEAIEKVHSGSLNLTLDTETPQGDTALHQAVTSCWCEGVELLLAAKCNPSAANGDARAPVHIAVLNGQMQILQMLLDAKADPKAQDADTDYDPRFKSKTLEEKPYEHRTPLHYAAELGNVTAMRVLLNCNVDVNAKDSKRLTPLHLCLNLRQREEEELEMGCGIKVVGLQKRPDLNSKIGTITGPRDKKTERWPVLVESETASEAILMKSENLEHLAEETLDTLLHARADVNLGNHILGESRTVLHEAAKARDVCLAKKVIAAGACVNQQDAQGGLSALHLAARAKSLELVQVLVEARADVAQVTSGGKIAAEFAKTNKASAKLVALLQGGVAEDSSSEEEEVKPKNFDELTPEQKAVLCLE